MYTKSDIMRMLMRRDDISKAEAIRLINRCQSAIDRAIDHGSYDEAEEALYQYLGIEIDYLMIFL